MLERTTRLSTLREVMRAEVKLDCLSKLVLLTKGRPLGESELKEGHRA